MHFLFSLTVRMLLLNVDLLIFNKRTTTDTNNKKDIEHPLLHSLVGV